MIAILISCASADVDSILDQAIGCTVTVEEHKRLAAYETEYGWERYRKAGIVVIDTLTGMPYGISSSE